MDVRRTPSPREPPASDAEGRAVTLYRWTCPICGETRPGVASGDEDPAEKSEFSMRQHVLSSDDPDHGSSNTYPGGFDPDAAGEFVSIE